MVTVSILEGCIKVNRDRYNIVDAPGDSFIFFTTAGYQYPLVFEGAKIKNLQLLHHFFSYLIIYSLTSCSC